MCSISHELIFNQKALEMAEDAKGVIRSHKSKDKQYTGQTKKAQGRNHDLKNTAPKTKDIATLSH